MSETITKFAEVPLAPKPALHAGHPFNNARNHETLLEYVRERMLLGKQHRDLELPRLVAIDQHVAGWIQHSGQDAEREKKEVKTGEPQAVKQHIPITFIHLDDMMTYFLETFAPNRGMFFSTGKKDELDSAKQIVTIFNNNAVYTGYYRQTARAVYNILKYNSGGFICNWNRDIGPVMKTGSNSELVLDMQEVWAGNRATALDNYNTFVDPSVELTDLYYKGEFAARAWIESRHSLTTKCAQGLYFNCEEAFANNEQGVAQATYYRSPPAEAKLNVGKSNSGATDWVSVLSMTDGYAHVTGFEIVEMYIKLNPYQLNLVPRSQVNKASRNRLEVWRVTLLNDKYIIDATYMNNMHGYLPFFFGVLNDDLMGKGAKSVAETIKPMASFASFLMNTHIAATRKNIWGLTVYDQSVVDLSSIPEGEVSARIAAKPMGQGRNIRDAIYEHDKYLDTKQTMQDMEAVFGVINQFFPTQSLPGQVAGIDRAVDSQVAAVMQGSTRRNHKAGKLLDDSLFRPLRFCMYWNVAQYQSDNVEIADFYGQAITVNLAELRQTNLPFIIGQGLKMLDRKYIAGELQNLIFAMIQSPQAGARFDMPGLINYWADMIDMDIDLSQFALQMQIDPATGQPVAGQEGEGIDPMTNPLAVTGPGVKPGVDAPA